MNFTLHLFLSSFLPFFHTLKGKQPHNEEVTSMNGYCKDCLHRKFGHCTLLKIDIDPFDTCRWYKEKPQSKPPTEKNAQPK